MQYFWKPAKQKQKQKQKQKLVNIFARFIQTNRKQNAARCDFQGLCNSHIKISAFFVIKWSAEWLSNIGAVPL